MRNQDWLRVGRWAILICDIRAVCALTHSAYVRRRTEPPRAIGYFVQPVAPVRISSTPAVRQRTSTVAVNTEKIASLIHQLLVELGEDPLREGLIKSPERVAKALDFLTSGYRTDPETLINGAIFTQKTNSMVIVKNIEVYSLCEHHMLPFFGHCHIGYIPTGRVFGVSKLARLVDMYGRRLQLQERLTEQISQVVMDSIDAQGVGVMIEARHLCMMMRGVEKQNSVMVTSSVVGTFRDSAATREEFLNLIGSRSS